MKLVVKETAFSSALGFAEAMNHGLPLSPLGQGLLLFASFLCLLLKLLGLGYQTPS